MTDDQRVYSDEEFALILRQASEMASRSQGPGPTSTGLTLTEMKAAAAQAGIDPSLVERAARVLASKTSASPFDRLIGGPVRHAHEAHFPVKLDENTAARLLSAVRITAIQAGSRDTGHSSSIGMTWHDGGELEALSVTARPEGDGTSVSVALARQGTLGIVATFSGIATLMVLLFASAALYPEGGAGLAVGGGIAGIGGIVAAARGYWAASTRSVQRRIGEVMDAIGQTLAHPESQSASGTLANRPADSQPDVSVGLRSEA